jgi:hypothetical protein
VCIHIKLLCNDRFTKIARDDNLGMGLDHPWVSDLIGAGMSVILYLRVAPASDPHRDGLGTSLVLHPRVTRRVSEKSSTIFFTCHPSDPAHLNTYAHVSLCIL